MNTILTPEQRQRRKKINLSIIGVIAFLLIIIFWAASGDWSTPSKASAIHHESVYNSEIDGSVLQVEQYLKHNLNDPSSYKPAEWGTVVRMPRDVPISPDDPYTTHTIYTYVVHHKFRAKNALGATILQSKVFTLDTLGNVIDVEDSGL